MCSSTEAHAPPNEPLEPHISPEGETEAQRGGGRQELTEALQAMRLHILHILDSRENGMGTVFSLCTEELSRQNCLKSSFFFFCKLGLTF